ncbi:hypothetical protein HOP50_01g08250 [Chloropicon primus]|uniref:Uncharacterized protein n=1 Tax=Chloropicon primus TaxID=1764295 RepID=A0A5B8MCZ5_9CHLO|nr:hypothetical protein A3770_01p08370 [Chloropicon primus]UPQ97530.1 hypothetical protein HOP50_01g08250 [Chloropicon primus]|mmetsp:Transcript_10918/g.30695  ORF Transcript_10918/g.30695 Transcript_10918/m.30695 type:complete len:168 (-) Transcript_10918:339-842(-)|eukprot:QDZ18319.1 hypothetical protein A3770_01p08370 [Chloropicon primus]
MGAASSSVAARRGAAEAKKRALPKYEDATGIGASGGGGTQTQTRIARPESYREAETFAPGAASSPSDKGDLDEMLKQLSGLVKERSVPIRMDEQAVAHARRLRKEVQKEVNSKRLSLRDVERTLRDPNLALERGVPRDIVQGLVESIRLPREEDYIADPDADRPPTF